MHDIKLINGRQVKFTEGSPEAALESFYRAFNSADLVLMRDNWLHTAEPSMSNPLGGVLRGWDEIRDVYQRIFDGRAEVYVEFYDYSIHQSGDFFCAVGREQGFFKTDDETMKLAIRTTRVYRKQEGQWRQLHHHGSIESPGLLADYQSAVTKRGGE